MKYLVSIMYMMSIGGGDGVNTFFGRRKKHWCMTYHRSFGIVLASMISPSKSNMIKKCDKGILMSRGGGWCMKVLVDRRGYDILLDTTGLRDVDTCRQVESMQY